MLGSQALVFRSSGLRCCVVGLSCYMFISCIDLGFHVLVCMRHALRFQPLSSYRCQVQASRFQVVGFTFLSVSIVGCDSVILALRFIYYIHRLEVLGLQVCQWFYNFRLHATYDIRFQLFCFTVLLLQALGIVQILDFQFLGFRRSRLQAVRFVLFRFFGL